jgi:Cu(I)/Ag(I) efflux system membrane fusion protein
MNRAGRVALLLVMLALAAGAGYWWGVRGLGSQAAPGGQGAPGAHAGQGTQASGQASERKILYYRNPMGLPDTSPVPKKDPMGMDYVPVFEGDVPVAGDGNTIRIGTEKIQRLGVRTEAATRTRLDRVVRAAGRVEVDERRVFAIAPKFEGWVERLFVNATGQPVSKNQPLFEVYSPELVSAQREYAIAAQGIEAVGAASPEVQASMRRLSDSTLDRLRNWDISEDQLRELARSGTARRTLVFRSPANGIVMEKKAVQGMRFMAGETLYEVADLSRVWVLADVFEQDIGQVRQGARAKVRIPAYPEDAFEGLITYVYPTLKAETRTVPVRLELANPQSLLKPAMFAQIELRVAAAGDSVSVPSSAVIDSGVRRIVLVDLGEGRFEPREVRVGIRTDERTEILSGVKAGENVVVAANFLIDAESNLKAAIGGFGHAAHGGNKPGASGTPAERAGGSAEPGASPRATVGHRAEGTVESVDTAAGELSVQHGPVASLGWPAMTMTFKSASPAQIKAAVPGARVRFEFVERNPGEWVITSIEPAGSAGARAPSAVTSSHQGH